MNEALNFLNQIAIQVQGLPFGTIGQYLAASGALSLLTVKPYQWIKRWSEHNKLYVQIFLGVGGALIAGGHYLLSTPSADPSIIWFQGAVLAFASQPIYVIGKMATIKFLAGVAKAQAVKAQNEAIKSQASTAAVPSTGLPISNPASNPTTSPKQEFLQ